MAALCTCSLLLVAAIAQARVPSNVKKAVDAYLRAGPDDEEKALAKALKAIDGDLEVAAEALRDHEPLTKGKAGTKHGLKFTSGGHEWEYSIRLPKGYKADKKYPVLVLPDHGAVGPEAGISFWEQSKLVQKVIIFRPVIVKFANDTSRFPDQQFFAKDQGVAAVMEAALTHLRLHYAVDHDRFFMTGLSQAGYYTWYYAVSFPDQFAAIIPESAGGVAVRAAVARLASNLKSMQVRILHTRGDQITPYSDAEYMRSALNSAGGSVELITYTDQDYQGNVPPKRHPGPHHLRLENVMLFGIEAERTFPELISREIRYAQQGREGRFVLAHSMKGGAPLSVIFSEEKGKLTCSAPGATYQVSPEDIKARRRFKVGRRSVRPKPDIEFMLKDFKSHGDPARLSAAVIQLAD